MLLSFLFGAAPPAHAQDSGSEPLSARTLPFNQIELMPDVPVFVISDDEMHVLDVWNRDFADWQTTFERWRHSKQPKDAISWPQFLERHPKPEPPSWLASVCPLLEDAEEFANSCVLLADWRDDPFLTKDRHASAAALQQREAPKNSVWWRNLHLDGLWSTTQSNVAALGLFGTHMTVGIEGRLQVFVAPGILLVSVPSLYGTRVLHPATDWGLTYRLFDFGRNTVHFNLVHAWMLGSTAQLQDAQLTLAGFSITRRPRPR